MLARCERGRSRLHAGIAVVYAANRSLIVDEPARHNLRITLALVAAYELLLPRLGRETAVAVVRASFIEPLGDARPRNRGEGRCGRAAPRSFPVRLPGQHPVLILEGSGRTVRAEGRQAHDNPGALLW